MPTYSTKEKLEIWKREMENRQRIMNGETPLPDFQPQLPEKDVDWIIRFMKRTAWMTVFYRISIGTLLISVSIWIISKGAAMIIEALRNTQQIL